MSQYGTYSPTWGWYIFGPLSAFLFQPLLFRFGSSTPVPGGSWMLAGPKGPYEWWYLSTTSDTTGIFAYCEGFGVPTPPPSDRYVGSYIPFRFRALRDVSTNSPYLVVYVPRSSYLAVLQLPFGLSAGSGVSIYVVFYFQNVPRN